MAIWSAPAGISRLRRASDDRTKKGKARGTAGNKKTREIAEFGPALRVEFCSAKRAEYST